MGALHCNPRAVLITWQLCPRCGALGPHLEHSIPSRALRRQCCGMMFHAGPQDPIPPLFCAPPRIAQSTAEANPTASG